MHYLRCHENLSELNLTYVSIVNYVFGNTDCTVLRARQCGKLRVTGKPAVFTAEIRKSDKISILTPYRYENMIYLGQSFSSRSTKHNFAYHLTSFS